MRFLLDVNVQVALSFPESESHRAAQRWFSAQPDRLWATCPLTQAGFPSHRLGPARTNAQCAGNGTRQSGTELLGPKSRILARGNGPAGPFSESSGSADWSKSGD